MCQRRGAARRPHLGVLVGDEGHDDLGVQQALGNVLKETLVAELLLVKPGRWSEHVCGTARAKRVGA